MKGSRLDWDSDFFGINVYKYQLEEQEFSRDIKFKKGLTYVFSKNKIKELESSLFDQKITYNKDVLSSDTAIDEKIYSYPKDKKVSDELLSLAYQSAAYSRFNVDPNIAYNKFLELYKLWILNSVNRTYSTEVLTYQIHKKDVGLITLLKKGTTCVIGLLAVNKSERGKKIGFKLMQAAQKWALNQGCTQLEVQTQKDNNVACFFYENLDYMIKNQEYIYHIWR